jgi:hypothetical protein
MSIAVLAERSTTTRLGQHLARPSAGASADAKVIADSLDALGKQLRHPSARAKPVDRPQADKPVAERLYDSLAAAKVMTAQVAMYLDREWRDRLFAQLDSLLDIEEWHEDESPVEPGSFRTFLRMILYLKPKRRPGLGLSQSGNLIAAWTQGTDRLTLELLNGDSVRWVLSCGIDGQRERAAGETYVGRLPEVLMSYRPARWFEDAKAAPAP